MDMCFENTTNDVIHPSSYTSLIKFWGRTILPPLLTIERRKEMSTYRNQAVIAETRLLKRRLEKVNLINKVQAVVDRIEKCRPSSLNLHPVVPVPHLEENDKGISLSNSSLCESNTKQNGICAAIVHSNAHLDDGLDSGELHSDDEKMGPGETNEDKHSLHKRSMSSDADLQMNRGIGSWMGGQHLGSYVLNPACFSFRKKCHSLGDICNSNNPFSSLNSGNNADNIDTVQPVVINEFCKPLSYDIIVHDMLEVNEHSSPEQKTSDFEDGDCNSATTVVLRASKENEFLDETDTESIPASVAQSTDLERYMDSSAEITGSSQGHSEQDKDNVTESSNCPSTVSNTYSSNTLTAYDCRNHSVGDFFHLRSDSSLSILQGGNENFEHTVINDEGNNETNTSEFDIAISSNMKCHIRRSSYTLEQPSLALIKVHEGCSCHSSPVEEKIFPHTSPIEHIDDNNTFPSISAEIQELAQHESFADKNYDQSCNEIEMKALSVSEHYCYDTASFCESAETPNSEIAEAEVLTGISVLSFAEKQITVLEEKQKQLKSYLQQLSETSVPPRKSKFTKFSSCYNESMEEDFSDAQSDLGFKNIANTTSCVDGRGDYNEVKIKKTSCPLVNQMQNFVSKNEQLMEKEYAFDNIHQHLQEYHEKQIEVLLEEQRRQWKQLQAELQQQLSNKPEPAGGFCHLASPDSNIPKMQKVSASSKDFTSQKSSIKIPPEVFHPSMKPKFDRLSATVKGYLTRRLMKTERVQDIIQTIKDTLECAVKLHQETPIRKGTVKERDVELHQRLISQLTASCYELHDIFFTLSTKEKMLIIAKSRSMMREKKQKEFISKPLQSCNRKLSTATLKMIERKRAKSSSDNRNFSLGFNKIPKIRHSPFGLSAKGFAQKRNTLPVDRPCTAPPLIHSSRNALHISCAQKSQKKTEVPSKVISKMPYRNVRRALYLDNCQEARQKKYNGITFS